MKRLVFIILSLAGTAALGNGYNDQWQSWLWDETGRTGLYAEADSSAGSNAAAMEARAATPQTSPLAVFSWLEARTEDACLLSVDLSIYNGPGFLLFFR